MRPFGSGSRCPSRRVRHSGSSTTSSRSSQPMQPCGTESSRTARSSSRPPERTRATTYGIFAATYTDRYYFDPDSGYVVAESYEERDTNPSASFRFRAEISLTASSYSVPLDLIPFALVDLGVPAAAVLAVAAAIRIRRGPNRLRIGSKDFPTDVRIRKAKSPADLVGLTSDGSPFFGPFLPLLAERSFAEHDP